MLGIGLKEKREAIHIETPITLTKSKMNTYRALRKKLNLAKSVQEADAIYEEIRKLLK
ncbi:hypothetical protein [Cohnella kolymensis]|uniref:hypothetical protein n=1 Tax=Cohnella kolymensis TaxID=1590652 RepID=UPI0013792E9C|nr:hypothetical protein [Cohnella kolymensis]